MLSISVQILLQLHLRKELNLNTEHLELVQLLVKLLSHPEQFGQQMHFICVMVISSGVEEIPDCTFQECTNLSYVSIASSVKKISFSAFRTCKSLERINIPAGVADLSSGYQFYGCSALKSITLPEGIKIINGNTFENCTSLEEVTHD